MKRIICHTLCLIFTVLLLVPMLSACGKDKNIYELGEYAITEKEYNYLMGMFKKRALASLGGSLTDDSFETEIGDGHTFGEYFEARLLFMLSAMLLGLVKKLSATTLYEWLFSRLALILLPALVMFWIAVGYRIGEYGFTENRIMIVILGAALSFSMVALLVCRTGRQYFGALLIWVVIMLTALALPVKHISVVSQKSRVEGIARNLGFVDENGNVDFNNNHMVQDFTAEQREIYKEFKAIKSIID